MCGTSVVLPLVPWTNTPVSKGTFYSPNRVVTDVLRDHLSGNEKQIPHRLVAPLLVWDELVERAVWSEPIGLVRAGRVSALLDPSVVGNSGRA
jgi:hypothetical protein